MSLECRRIFLVQGYLRPWGLCPFQESVLVAHSFIELPVARQSRSPVKAACEALDRLQVP